MGQDYKSPVEGVSEVEAQRPGTGQGGLRVKKGLNDKKCVWLGVSLGLDLAFLDAD